MSPESLLAILGMAAVSFAVKPAGLFLASRLPADGFAAAWLRHIPGAVLAALIAPAVLAGGPDDALAALVTAGVMIATRNLFAAMAAGVLAVYLIRTFLGL